MLAGWGILRWGQVEVVGHEAKVEGHEAKVEGHEARVEGQGVCGTS